MIPILRQSNPYFPVNTIIFRDSLWVTKDKIVEILSQFDGSNKLFDMVVSKFAMYEIIVGDVFLLYNMFNDIYTEYQQYYKELLENYNKAYDYALGNRRRTLRHDTSNTEKSGNRSGMSTDINDTYELPNKQVNNPYGYLTGRDKTDGVDSSQFNEDGNNEYNSEVNVIYDNEFLDLKRKYLAQIRNVYAEFAEKFNECFIKVFN